jgi:hypothetical protein
LVQQLSLHGADSHLLTRLWAGDLFRTEFQDAWFDITTLQVCNHQTLHPISSFELSLQPSISLHSLLQDLPYHEMVNCCEPQAVVMDGIYLGYKLSKARLEEPLAAESAGSLLDGSKFKDRTLVKDVKARKLLVQVSEIKIVCFSVHNLCLSHVADALFRHVVCAARSWQRHPG